MRRRAPWRAFCRRRVELTVRADQVRKGDRIIPKEDGGTYRRVVETKTYSDAVSSVILIVVPRGWHHDGIYLPGDPVSIQRRVR